MDNKEKLEEELKETKGIKEKLEQQLKEAEKNIRYLQKNNTRKYRK
ncbi:MULTISPECIES: hypothetical protein [unclassified Spiroplasma]